MRSKYLANLYSVKRFLNQISEENDVVLEMLMDDVIGEIEGYCQRPLKLRRYSEIHNYDETIILRNYPVMNVNSITAGTTALTFDDDYQVDLAEGIVYPLSQGDAEVSINALNIEYDAGYFSAHIHEGNNKIDFEETSGIEKTAEIAVGIYDTPETDGETYIKSPATLLAEAIKTAMDVAGDSVYTVPYDLSSAGFTLTSDLSGGAGIFNLIWSTGSHFSQSTGSLIGFDVTEDDTGAGSYTSDMNDECVSPDLRSLFLNMMRLAWERYNHDNLLANVAAERIPDGSSITYKYNFDITQILPSFQRILDKYSRKFIG